MKDGEECNTYEECKQLLADGSDIDYNGVGGPYEFSDAGEPTEASFAILQYGDDNQIDDSATVYKFAVLET